MQITLERAVLFICIAIGIAVGLGLAWMFPGLVLPIPAA